MKGRKIAKILQVIGIAEAVCGVIVAIAIWSSFSDSGVIGISVIIASFITCMMLIGFSDVINLLQRSVDMQIQILSRMNEQLTNSAGVSKSALQDIESNLPEM